MRNKFIEYLINHNTYKKNKSYLLVGDVGFSVIENFKKLFPRYYLNVGVAEQNLASIAAGIASEGGHVFTYSIANFPTFRCAEQIRNTIDYHNLNVTIVSIGGGLEYGSLGYSHHAIQDYALMRIFPNMTILSPCDDDELKLCINYCFKKKGPKYLRLSKNNYKKIKKLKVNKHFNQINLKTGNDTCILSTGCSIRDYTNINEHDSYTCPIWGEKYKKNISLFLNNYKKIFVIEDHIFSSGFGSFIMECCEENNLDIKIKKKCLPNKIIGKVGSEIELKEIAKFKINI